MRRGHVRKLTQHIQDDNNLSRESADHAAELPGNIVLDYPRWAMRITFSLLFDIVDGILNILVVVVQQRLGFLLSCGGQGSGRT